MTIAADEGPRRKFPGSPENTPTTDAGDDSFSFCAWLDVIAPMYARLYLRYGSPLWYAVLDLRAAMILDSFGDSSSDDWCHEHGIRWRAPRTLASCGILLPEALFNRVRRIHEESKATLGQEAYDLRKADADADGDTWARYWLFGAARDALRYGPETVTRRRYGCDPDKELMR